MFSPARARDILLFWFGPRPYSAVSLQQRARLWFGAPRAPELIPQTDELIRQRFAGAMRAAETGTLGAWDSSPRRRLALILLLDQFSRHCHRGTARAYAQDHQALALCVTGMLHGADAALDPVERIFFYMPLQHAESTEVQEESVAAFRRLLGEAPLELRGTFEDALEAAVSHRDTIRRFGRFPNRNAALAREPTTEEQGWLAGSAPAWARPPG
jgi:uncharacterized protein (DUF924 family)